MECGRRSQNRISPRTSRFGIEVIRGLKDRFGLQVGKPVMGVTCRRARFHQNKVSGLASGETSHGFEEMVRLVAGGYRIECVTLDSCQFRADENTGFRQPFPRGFFHHHRVDSHDFRYQTLPVFCGQRKLQIPFNGLNG